MGTDNRYHALDAVRAFALLLGVVFHAAESFEPDAVYYWAIADRSPSGCLNLFRYASHSFRLELFFLIAGFFAHLLWQRRGVRGFIRNRAGRILVPLIVGWLLLYPLLVFLWITGVAKSGRWDLLAVPLEFRSVPPWQLTIGFFAHLEFLRHFDLTHLWFLYELLVLYALALSVRGVVLQTGSTGIRVIAWMERWVAVALRSRFRVVWFAVAAAPWLYAQQSWTVDTPKESLLPALAPTLLFALLFGLGWALHRQPELLEACGRHWHVHLGIAVLLVVPNRFGPSWIQEAAVIGAFWVRLGHAVLYGVMMGGFVFGVLGCFLRFRRTESPAWRYIADASYWIYLAHLPLVVSLQIGVSTWPVSWMVKYPLINLVAFPLLFLSYHWLVRPTFIGQQLNGRRVPVRGFRLAIPAAPTLTKG